MDVPFDCVNMVLNAKEAMISSRKREMLRQRHSIHKATKARLLRYPAMRVLANLEAAPNGASMRPNSLFQRGLVSSLKGKNFVVYSVAAGKSANFLVVN
jgi:hypothetical protein